MTDWKKTLGDLAPTIGSAFGVLGTAGGLAIKSILGLSSDASDDDINTALLNPENQVKLKQMEFDYKTAKLQAEATTVQAVNVTMQSEATSEHWLQWAWRPLWGIASAGAFAFVCVLFCILAYKAVLDHDSNAMQMLPQVITSFTTLFGIPAAICGITAWHRGVAQIEEIKNQH